ncbi:MAG: hypothetical protein RL265_988, partial [Bacteroidota bacterium]
MKIELQQLIRNKSLEIFEKVKEYREYIHENPELSYAEFKTMEYVSSILTNLGIQHQKGIGKTGVVAL